MLKYVTLILLGISWQLTLANIEGDLQNLNIAGIGELPGNITSKIPNEKEIEKIMSEKCKKNGGIQAYQDQEVAKKEAIECVKGLVNFDELQQEMEKAKPVGDLDTVFKKYCEKSPQFKECIANFTTALQPCLDENEKSSVTTVLNVTEQLAEFVCYKGGDRIALFIAEGGPECLNASREAITECVDTVFKKKFPDLEQISVDDIPLLLFQADQCEDFFKLQTCVVRQLEKCQEPTPANIVDSLFNFIKKVTPCSAYKFVEESAESASQSGSTAALGFTSSLFTITCSFALLRLFSSN